MEIEATPQLLAKKMWNIMRVVLYMLRKGISKTKLILDLQTLLKSGKIAGKAITGLLHHHHYSALTCSSVDVRTSIVAPRDYEFSCSNSPALPFVYNHPKHKYNLCRHCHRRQYQVEDARFKQKVFDVLSDYEAVEASPLGLPGFGASPMVRQLRVTDSPFSVMDSDDQNTQVDKDAEEFIKKFYKELNQQRRVAALEPPSPYHNLWFR